MRINVTPTADRPRGVKRKGEKRPAEPITPFGRWRPSTIAWR